MRAVFRYPGATRRNAHRLYGFISAALACVSAEAAEPAANGPVHYRTQNPIYLLSLGQNTRGPAVQKKNSVSVWMDVTCSSIVEYGRNGDNELLLDMELIRTAFNAACGLGDRAEAAIEVPFLYGHAGIFDGLIRNYHRVFGFPNGARNAVPDNEFAYRVIKDGELLYEVRRMNLGPGDAVVGIKRSIVRGHKVAPDVACLIRCKLPTGDRSAGLGSGSTDYSFGVSMEKVLDKCRVYSNVDYILVSGNRLFSDLYDNDMLAWLVAAEVSLKNAVSLVLQIQGSTPLLHGLGITEWDDPPLDLIIGLQGTRSNSTGGKEMFWKWSFTEDLSPDGPSVDIGTTLTVGLRM